MQMTFPSPDNKLIQIITEPRYRWLRHMLFFMLLLVTYNSTMITYMGDLGIIGRSVVYLTVIQFVIYLIIVYVNIYLLVPRLFLKNRYIAYCITLLLILTVSFFSGYFLEYFIHSKYSIEPGRLSYMHGTHIVFVDFISDILVTGMCCIGTTITILFRNWLVDGRRREELGIGKYRAKLLKYKNSVSPGFLSDTLEKAAAEAGKDSARSVDLLSRLSRFLRYRLYDSKRDSVMLKSEFSFLDNYLSMMRSIRSGFDYKIILSEESLNIAVAPSVLINITDSIMNAFNGDVPVELIVEFGRNSKDTSEVCFRVESEEMSSLAESIARDCENILKFTYSPEYILNYGTGYGSLEMRVLLMRQYPVK